VGAWEVKGIGKLRMLGWVLEALGWGLGLLEGGAGLVGCVDVATSLAIFAGTLLLIL
jgi:hypothetical protein